MRIIRKAPEYISEYYQTVLSSLEDTNNHGVLLGALAFLENAILIEPEWADKLIGEVGRLARLYKKIAYEYNADYEISGINDPFLQVAILRLLRLIRKYHSSEDKTILEVMVMAHDVICAKIMCSSRNGVYAVLFECFRCLILMDPNPRYK